MPFTAERSRRRSSRHRHALRCSRRCRGCTRYHPRRGADAVSDQSALSGATATGGNARGAPLGEVRVRPAGARRVARAAHSTMTTRAALVLFGSRVLSQRSCSRAAAAALLCRRSVCGDCPCRATRGERRAAWRKREGQSCRSSGGHFVVTLSVTCRPSSGTLADEAFERVEPADSFVVMRSTPRPVKVVEPAAIQVRRGVMSRSMART